MTAKTMIDTSGNVTRILQGTSHGIPLKHPTSARPVFVASTVIAFVAVAGVVYFSRTFFRRG